MPDLDSPQTLVLVFGSSSYLEHPEALSSLRAAFPRAHLAGCSSAGEICGTRVRDGSLSFAVMRFAHTAVRVVESSLDAGASSRAAGEALARAALGDKLRAVFVLSDGVAVNGTELLDGMHAVLPPDVVVTGGLAGDGTAFRRTWVLRDETPRRGIVVGVALYGDAVRVDHGSRGGWDAFGPERVVTRAEGNVLYELDGAPALALYKRYLGERAKELPATALLFPVALRAREDGEDVVVRTILSVDESSQSMTFAGDIPSGGVAQLMRANLDRLIEGAAQASHAARSVTSDALTLAVSCVGRRLVLGERVEEELDATQEAAPGGPMVGFYSYGEISPTGRGERARLHNQTMTVTRLWEA
ncbi:MAG: FIST N-terminal domain-containing protein [Polyangiales bacterium]